MVDNNNEENYISDEYKKFLIENIEEYMLEQKKVLTPLGTFNDKAFQLEIKTKDKNDNNQILEREENINIPIFDMLGYHCIPHVGVYGDNYEPFVPIVLLKLQAEGLLKSDSEKSFLPQELKDRIDYGIIDNTEVYVSIHPKPILGECQHLTCNNIREVNLMFHPWVYQGYEFSIDLDVSETIHTGLFGYEGVASTHMDAKEECFRGIQLDFTGPRECTVHNQRFSPLNNQIYLLEDVPYYSFFCLTQRGPLFEPYKQVISYHLLPATDQLEQDIEKNVYDSTSLKDLLLNLLNIPVIQGPTYLINHLISASGFQENEEQEHDASNNNQN